MDSKIGKSTDIDDTFRQSSGVTATSNCSTRGHRTWTLNR